MCGSHSQTNGPSGTLDHGPARGAAHARKAHATADSPTLLNIPNALCAYRIAGSVVLAGLAFGGRGESPWFFGLLVTLVLSDWIDGKLAVWLRQRTVFGARLDTFADMAMYASVVVSAWKVRWDAVAPEAPWFAAAFAAYAISVAAGYRKYGRWPSYHTRGVEVAWFLAGIAMIGVFGGGSPWILRATLLFVTLANIEAIAMTRVLSTWHADVLSLAAARRLERRAGIESRDTAHGP